MKGEEIMDHPFLVLAAIAALGLVYVVTPVVTQVFMQYRKTRNVTCPEEAKRAAVSIDARTAALTSAWGRPNLRVKNCSLWPQKSGCAQGCLVKSA
jgi:hypothetical protein